tara:strand:- start:238 stop:573 length:336 start_codon:yes stop_codon:yes gene_type:complete
MARYHKTLIFNNASEYYAPLRKSRNLKSIVHHETPKIYNPGVLDRMSIVTTDHVWSYGDRYYKLAHQYYGDANFWWVIAWYNSRPTESHLKFGEVITIPVNIQDAFAVLGV